MTNHNDFFFFNAVAYGIASICQDQLPFVSKVKTERPSEELLRSKQVLMNI